MVKTTNQLQSTGPTKTLGFSTSWPMPGGDIPLYPVCAVLLWNVAEGQHGAGTVDEMRPSGKATNLPSGNLENVYIIMENHQF